MLVRAETGDTVFIKRLLDIGVMTCSSLVESADQAAQIVAAAGIRPPVSRRGDRGEPGGAWGKSTTT